MGWLRVLEDCYDRLEDKWINWLQSIDPNSKYISGRVHALPFVLLTCVLFAASFFPTYFLAGKLFAQSETSSKVAFVTIFWIGLYFILMMFLTVRGVKRRLSKQSGGSDD